MNWDLRVLLLLIVIHSERLYNLSVPKLHRAMAYCEVIFNFPAQKYCHTTNGMFIFLTRNQKNIKRGDTEAVARRCSVKKVFLDISQNSQENTYVKVSFLIKLQASGLRPATLLKKRLWRRCFPVNLAKFLRTTFLIEPLRWLLLTILKAR